MFKCGMLGNSGIMEIIKNFSITCYDFINYCFTYYKTLIWNYKFSLKELINEIEAPLGRNISMNKNLNIVFVLPELQPRKYLFESPKILFCGPAIDDGLIYVFFKIKLSNNSYFTYYN